ncbi:MAG: hypothetical protein V4714_04330 [Bacteroidota bacterium]
MKHIRLTLIVLSISMLLTSCAVVGGIFKAGVWSGVIVVILLVVLVIWLFSRFRQ